MTVRILIVDDHPVVREGLKAILGKHAGFEICGEAGCGREAATLTGALKPDIVLLDLRLPDMAPAAVVKQVLAAHPTSGVLVLSAFGGGAEVGEVLRAGARGYLRKDAPRKELQRAIESVYRGRRHIASDAAAAYATAAQLAPLTQREFDVMHLIADGRPNAYIAKHLNLSVGTVKTHVHAILKKLDAHDRTEALSIALRHGLLRLG